MVIPKTRTRIIWIRTTKSGHGLLFYGTDCLFYGTDWKKLKIICGLRIVRNRKLVNAKLIGIRLKKAISSFISIDHLNQFEYNRNIKRSRDLNIMLGMHIWIDSNDQLKTWDNPNFTIQKLITMHQLFVFNYFQINHMIKF